jgi:hypothetical protein
MVRTAGGWAALKAYCRRNIYIKGDEGILGERIASDMKLKLFED